MGEKDITEKILADYNDVFADIMNGLLFAGEQRILPEALENTSIHSQYKAEDEKVHELERDVAKYWKEKEVELAICGIENQSVVEKNMPFRVIGYDGTAYRSQLLEERKKILPVVTIVLYFGTDRHWNSKKNIKSLMEIPEGLDKFVNDYSMQVFEIAWLTEEEIERFQSDFRIVANFFVKKRKNKDYIPDDPTEIKHVDEVLKLLQQQKPYEWIKGMYEQKSYTVSENTGYNKTKLQEQLKSLNCAQAENQTAPENAYVAVQDGQFVIVPETEGSKLNIKQAYQVLDAAVESGQTSVNFADTPEAYVSADVTQNDQALQSALEACKNYTRASITYTFGDRTETLDGNTIKDWLQFDEKGQLVWDDNSFQQHVADYVAQLAATYDTVGTEREFQTTSGRTVYVSSSVYGWKIDQSAETAQLSKEIQSGTQTTREPVFSQTANAYGVNDLGNTYIEVDLSEQHMYYYQNGADIFESDFVSGNMSYADRQTHAGIFTLYYKKSPDVLRGTMKADGTYEYESKVEYWMPFDGGIGFHDASWRGEFGGDIYLTDGSHGCINMPPENAGILYDLIQYDVPIVCFY